MAEFFISNKELDKATKDYGASDAGGSITIDNTEIQSQPAPQQPTAPMGRGEQFFKGVRSGLEGVNLGLAQAASAVLPEFMAPDPQRLQEMEAERRAKALETKQARGGQPGVGNIGSWGEFAGEALPTLIPVGRVVQGAKYASPIAKYAITAGKGAATGAGLGLLQPTVEGESKLQNAFAGAILGAGLAPAARLAGVGIKKGIETGVDLTKRALATQAAKGTIEGAKQAYSGANRAIISNLQKVIPPTPGKIQGKARVTHEMNNQEAIKDVVRMLPEIEVLNSTSGVMEKGLRPRNLAEAVSAVENSMETQMGWTNQIINSAEGAQLRVNPLRSGEINPRTGQPTTLADELAKVKFSNGWTDSQEATAKKYLAKLKEEEAAGGITPMSAVNRMKGLNNDIRAINEGKNVSGDNAEVLGMIAHYTRSALNDTMDKIAAAGGERFADLRKSWGRQSAVLDGLYRATDKEVAKTARGGQSVYDILAAEQLMSLKIKEGLMNKAIAATRRHLYGPDAAVENMFKAAEDVVKKEGKGPMKAPDLSGVSSQTPPTFDPSTGKWSSVGPSEGQATPRGTSTQQTPVAPTPEPTTGPKRINAQYLRNAVEANPEMTIAEFLALQNKGK